MMARLTRKEIEQACVEYLDRRIERFERDGDITFLSWCSDEQSAELNVPFSGAKDEVAR